MNQKELISRIHDSTLMEKKSVGNALSCLADIIHRELKAGRDVTLPGIGKLSVGHRPARTGRNPSTGEKIEIAAKRTPKFAAAKALKDAVA